MIPKGALRCFLDGDALCIVKDDFEDLEASDARFIKLSTLDLAWVASFQKQNERKIPARKEKPPRPMRTVGDFND